MSAMVEYYEQRIAKLEAEVREVTARLNQNSRNSSKPPSSDGPHVKRKPPQPPSGQARWAARTYAPPTGVSASRAGRCSHRVQTAPVSALWGAANGQGPRAVAAPGGGAAAGAAAYYGVSTASL